MLNAQKNCAENLRKNVDPLSADPLHGGMRLTFATLCLFAVTILHAFGQDSAESFTLHQYIIALDSYASRTISQNMGRSPSLVNTATIDPNLAKFPYVRGVTLGVLQEINLLFAAADQDFKKLQILRKQPKIITGQSYDLKNPYKPPTNSQPLDKERKIEVEAMTRKETAEKNIKARLSLLKQQINTPLGQQFSMPATSPLIISLRGGSPTAPKQGANRNFEAISSAEGGLLAYIQTLVVTKTEGRSEEVMVTDRTKTVFVRGYTKPVTLGEVIKIKVISGETKILNGMTLREFVMID